ncbi:hypothetical protein E4K10_49905 [Streptomyces sp. T1317-0309]|nr:hypothetical protein E4K10_49905 [Streptomyces sp. T1317-0309]
MRAWNTPTDKVIGLQWDPVPGAMFYRVYRSDVGNTEPAATAWTPSSTPTRCMRIPRTPSTWWPCRPPMKPGGQSSKVTLKTKPVTLAKPTGLKASAITRTSFRVTCNQGAGGRVLPLVHQRPPLRPE